MFALAASSYMLLLLALFFIGGMLFAFAIVFAASKSAPRGDDPDYGAAA